MKTAVVYVHGKGGSAAEAEHYKPLFPDCDVVGFDYKAQTPWDAVPEFTAFFAEMRRKHDTVIPVANSIGAYFSMSALSAELVDKALFISPVVDMERLISDMMGWAGITEETLRAQGEIATDFGETLSWAYLCYVRAHPLVWNVPTRILYGEKDNLTSLGTLTAFAQKIHAPVTVMPGGEHWFHTKEQMDFLDKWIREQHI
ncbi:alpha/beta hydrolase [Gemmiger sp.]